jgi:hypothetical protein
MFISRLKIKRSVSVRAVVVLPTASASETINAVIYMESEITRHVVLQSVHADRRFATAARFGAMTEADVRSPTGMPHRLPEAVRSFPDEADAVCGHAILHHGVLRFQARRLVATV